MKMISAARRLKVSGFQKWAVTKARSSENTGRIELHKLPSHY